MNIKKIAILIVVFASVVASIYYLSSRSSTENTKIPDGYTKVDEYNHIEPGEPACRALTPECGYCSGMVVDKACYVSSTSSGNKQP